jgi:eukaryotic-like serine/threonine-protein kinase
MLASEAALSGGGEAASVLKWRALTAEPRVRPDRLEEEDFPVPFGRYTLLGLLGEGGMARVFRAELRGPRGFRKRAAVKVIRASAGDQGRRLNRALIHEAMLGGLLHHPNVVETYDFGEEAGQAWIAMEQVRGVSLDELLGGGAPLPTAVALEVGAQICAGLHHAHTLEHEGTPTPLVHRDLKPTNVMVADSGLVKVLDFGIAKATHVGGHTTETGLTKGTPAYMSPEQAQAEPVDGRSDVFAAGALLYELLTGKRFFRGDTVYQIMLRVAMVEERLQDPSLPTTVEGAVPGAWSVVRRCLRADRDERFASAEELEQAIRALQGPVQAPGPIKAWVDRCRAEGDPRFQRREPETPARIRVGSSAALEELSLDATDGLPVAPAPPSSPTLVPSGAAPPGGGSSPPTAEPGPTRPMAAAVIPPAPTLQPTRLVAPPRPRSKGPLLALALGGAALLAIGIAVVVVVLLRILPSGPGSDTSDLAVVERPLEAGPADEGASADPVGTTAEQDTAAFGSHATPSPKSASASTRSPAAVEPAPTWTPSPPPRSPEPEPPAPSPSARLAHEPPESLVIGSPVRISVAVDPPGACRPRLRYAPWDPSDGGWKSERLVDAGGGEWETDLRLPYEVAWRSGFRYQLRCEDAGRLVAAWPESGSVKVPALTR